MLETNSTDIASIVKAAHYAADKHRYCRRKDADRTPYINHPLALADILANEGHVTDVDVLVAALLHDVVEDTETSLDEIADVFGGVIAGIVDEVSDDKDLPKAERKQVQIETMAGKSSNAKLVKIADKISNLRDIVAHPPADWSDDRKQAYFDFSRDVVASCRGLNAPLEKAFDASYADGFDFNLANERKES